MRMPQIEKLNEHALQNINDISGKIIDSAFNVHKGLGPGLLESVYETCMIYELKKRGLIVESQLSLPITYDGIILEGGYRIDLLVENQIIVEIKTVETILPVHKAQLLTYLKLSDHKLGLLLNFNVPLIKEGITRIIQ